jgi:DNA ligase-1
MTLFRPMLADNKKISQELIQRHLDEVGFLIMQPKIDGMRALIDADGIPRTRSGKEHKNKYLRRWAFEHPSLRGLDGEVVSGHQMSADSFRDSMSGIRSEEGSPEFTFYAFDWFTDPHADQAYTVRHTAAGAVCSNLGLDQHGREGLYHARLLLCPQREVRSLDEVNAHEEELLAAGWEGAMLRRPDRPYKYNRSTNLGGNLIKLKRFDDDEAVIVGSFAWEQNNNEPTLDARGYTVRSSHQENRQAMDRLGGFNCELLRDRSIKFDIGVFRGWGHSDRERLWVDRDNLVGRVLKFKHQGYGGGYDKPRTPVGLGFRDIDDIG